jgi:hypothetical protein
VRTGGGTVPSGTSGWHMSPFTVPLAESITDAANVLRRWRARGE